MKLANLVVLMALLCGAGLLTRHADFIARPQESPWAAKALSRLLMFDSGAKSTAPALAAGGISIPAALPAGSLPAPPSAEGTRSIDPASQGPGVRLGSSPGEDFGPQISAAYSSAPPTGAYLYLGADATITSPTTITMTDGKPLILDLAGRTLTFKHGEGTGLAFIAGRGNTRNMRITIRNGTIVYASTARGITGISVVGLQYVTFSNLQILYFGSSSSTAVNWYFVEDSLIENTEFRGNTIALTLNSAANNNEFRNVWFQENGTSVRVLNGSQGNTFLDCLFQSNNATSTVSLVSSSGDSYPMVTNNRFIGCWFEDNGDKSKSSVSVLMKADASREVTHTTFENCLFYPSGFGRQGAAMGFSGNGTVGYNVYENNTIGGPGSIFALGRSVGKEVSPIVLSEGMFRSSHVGGVGIGTTAPDALLTVNGAADKPGGGSWGTYSDARLKTVGESFRAGLPQVLKLHPIYYRYKDQNALGISDHGRHVGLLGQEVEKVIPEAVTRNTQGYLVLNNDPIQLAMLNAIKQQQAQIQALAREVQELRAKEKTLRHPGKELPKCIRGRRRDATDD